MTDQSETTATTPEVALALALARERTSPPDNARPDKDDRAKARRLLAALGKFGWRLER